MSQAVRLPVLYETVIVEVLQLARLHMVGALRVPEQDIQVAVRVVDGRLCPEFSLSNPPATRFEQQRVHQVMFDIWDGWLRTELAERLHGLYEERLGCVKP